MADDGGRLAEVSDVEARPFRVVAEVNEEVNVMGDITGGVGCSVDIGDGNGAGEGKKWNGVFINELAGDEVSSGARVEKGGDGEGFEGNGVL